MTDMLKEENQVTGCLESPPDSRDYIISKALTDFPKEFSLDIPKVKNQMITCSCVAHALSSINEFYYEKELKEPLQFSTGLIYGYRPEGYHQGTGMFIREALKTEQKIGNVPNFIFSNNSEMPRAKAVVDKNIDNLIPTAECYKITTYAQLNGINEIKTSLMNEVPVVLSIPTFRGGFNTDLSGFIKQPKADATKAGNHAVACFGWKNINGKEALIILNSWGYMWGKAGKGYLSVDYPINEAWAVSDQEHSKAFRKPKTSWLGELLYFIKNLV